MKVLLLATTDALYNSPAPPIATKLTSGLNPFIVVYVSRFGLVELPTPSPRT